MANGTIIVIAAAVQVILAMFLNGMLNKQIMHFAYRNSKYNSRCKNNRKYFSK